MAEDPLTELADEDFARRRRGEAVTVRAFAAEHPGHGAELREVLPVLELLERARFDEGEAPPPVREIGPYRILREVGRGGMGIVYEARQKNLDRHVALKVLPPHAAVDPRFQERFQREANAAAGLDHPHIVPVFGAGEHDGVPYYVMQFVDGLGLDRILAEVGEWRVAERKGDTSTASLSDLAQAVLAGDATGEAALSGPSGEGASSSVVTVGARTPSRDLYYRSVARLWLAAAEGLAYAHSRGVQHRDVKPSNLMLDRSGRLWITDFGLCKVEGAGDLTQTGEVVGSVRYMAPERFSGEGDARSDVYGLGVTFYELLTLQPAFEGLPDIRLAKRIAETVPTRPRKIDPNLPVDLETIVRKSMDRLPESRYATAADMAADLRAYLDARPIKARPPTPGYLLWMLVKRHKAATIAVVLGLLLLGAATVYYVVDLQRAWRDALAARETSEFNSAVANLVAAEAAIRAHDPHLARSRLAQVPERFREWEWRFLDAAVDRSLATMQVEGTCWGLDVSPAGTCLAVWGRRGSIGIVDLARGRETRRIPIENTTAWSADFSPDGRRLIVGTHEECAVRIWRLDDPDAAPLRLPGTTGRVTGVCFGADGRRAAAASLDAMVRVWDAQSGELLHTIGGAPEAYCIAFHPSGSRVAVGFRDGNVSIWNLETAARTNYPGHTHEVKRLAFSPDGAKLASASRDGTVRLLDLGTGSASVLGGHDREVFGLGFSRDSRRLVTGAADQSVQIWNAETGQWITTFRGHDEIVWGAGFLPDGRVVSVGVSGCIKTWDIDAVDLNRAVGRHLTHGLEGLAFSPTGDRLYTIGFDSTIRVHDPQREEEMAVWTGIWSGCGNLAISKDGRWLVAASGLRRPAPVVFDTRTGRVARILEGHTDRVHAVAFHPSGRWLVSGSEDRTIKIWDRETGECLRTLKGHEDTIRAILVTPDGKRIISGARDNTIGVWVFASGEREHVLRGHTAPIIDMDLDPTGRILVTGARDHTARLWDLERLEPLHVLRAHNKWVRTVAFHPNGRRVATSGGTVVLWDVERGEPTITLDYGEPSAPWEMMFSPGGEMLALASSRGRVYAWRTTPVAEWFPARRAARRTRVAIEPWVRARFADGRSAEEVVAAIEADPAMDETTRRSAHRLACSWPGRLAALRETCWRMVRAPTDPESDEFFVTANRAWCLLKWDHRADAEMLVLLGLVRYRAAKYARAVRELRTAAVAAADAPALLALARAFQALAHERIDQPGLARRALAPLRGSWDAAAIQDANHRMLLREAKRELGPAGHDVSWMVFE